MKDEIHYHTFVYISISVGKKQKKVAIIWSFSMFKNMSVAVGAFTASLIIV